MLSSFFPQKSQIISLARLSNVTFLRRFNFYGIAKFPFTQACVILFLSAGWPNGRGGHPFEGPLRVGQRFPRRRPGLSLRLWHLPAQALAGTHPATHHSHIAQLKRDAAPSMLRQRGGLRQHIRKSQQKHRPPGTYQPPMLDSITSCFDGQDFGLFW